MPILSVDKTIDRAEIARGGAFRVTLRVTAAPKSEAFPADIALVLDRSGSMRGAPMAALKAAARDFVDALAKGTDKVSGQNRIGVISFASTATEDAPLTQDVAALDGAIDALEGLGNTNTGYAFAAAETMLDGAGGQNRKMVILFTDGEPTIGPDPTPVAERLRSKGAEIYCIGFEGSDGINIELLNAWASAPADEHVLIAPTAQQIEDAFGKIADDLVTPGATNIVIHELPAGEFSIESVDEPTLGDAELLAGGALRWTIPVLGADAQQTASLTFTLRDTGGATGPVKVNESVTLSDDARERVVFPDPVIDILAGPNVAEPCPVPVQVTAPPCADSVHADLGDVTVPGMGRMLTVSLTLKNVCPAREVAVGILVTEVLDGGGEAVRGYKSLTVPAQGGDACADVQLDGIRFVLPETAAGGMCAPRTFRVRAFANAASGAWGAECLAPAD